LATTTGPLKRLYLSSQRVNFYQMYDAVQILNPDIDNRVADSIGQLPTELWIPAMCDANQGICRWISTNESGQDYPMLFDKINDVIANMGEKSCLAMNTGDKRNVYISNR